MPRNPRQGLTTLAGLLLPALILLVLAAATASLADSKPTALYDANGNMLTGLGGKIIPHDGENRPLSVTWLGKLTCYVYGVDGKRLKKVEGLPPTQDCTTLPANANTTVYFGAVEVRNWLVAGAEQVLTYPHPAVKLLNGTTPAAATWLHRDGLSSVRAITNPAGAKIEAALYKPFGEQSEWVLPGNAAPETKGWIGERYDADAGLQYLNARYYDPELSLFLQPDWFEVTNAGVGTNRFSYSFNDPVNKFDPGGNQTTTKPNSDDERSRQRAEAREQIRKAARTTRLASTTETAASEGVSGILKRAFPAASAIVFGLGIGPTADPALDEAPRRGAALPAGLSDHGYYIDGRGDVRDPAGEKVVGPSSSEKGLNLNVARLRHRGLIDRRVAELEAFGYQVTREVSFMVGNKTARLDIVGSLNGVPMFGIEGKTGDGGLVRNQPDVFGAFENGTAIPFGDNAASAGFNTGQPIGRPMPFEILR